MPGQPYFCKLRCQRQLDQHPCSTSKYVGQPARAVPPATITISGLSAIPLITPPAYGAAADENQKLSGQNGGTSFHKDIWRKIMTRVHEGLSDPGFTVPDSVETAEICRKSGKLAIPGVCSHDPRGNAVYTEYFAKGTVPTEMCNTHVLTTVCSVTGLLPGTNCPKTSRVRIASPARRGRRDR